MKKIIKNPLFQMGTFDSSEAKIRSFQFLKNKQLEYCIRADKDYQGHDQVAVFIGDEEKKLKWSCLCLSMKPSNSPTVYWPLQRN